MRSRFARGRVFLMTGAVGSLPLSVSNWTKTWVCEARRFRPRRAISGSRRVYRVAIRSAAIFLPATGARSW